MARTGINIKVSDTVLGSPPQVNANTILFVEDTNQPAAGDVPEGGIAFEYHTPYMLRSVDDLANLGITQANNPALYKQVSDFYGPISGLTNTGTILWIVGFEDTESKAEWTSTVLSAVRATVLNGFQYRPRMLVFSWVTNISTSGNVTTTPLAQADIQGIIDTLYTEGFSTVALTSPRGLSAKVSVVTPPSLETAGGPMVGTVIISESADSEARACVGKIAGLRASLSVGTSIGDTSLPMFGSSFYFLDPGHTPCASIPLTVASALGEAQYIFARTRPPKNGLWLNDGATANDPANALSTLEAGVTIASMVDDLRTFFTPYINTKVPCTSAGDIDPAYKAIVLTNARQQIIAPYIQSGDISDATIDLKATNDDMVGTRTWEVTLSILPAPTLRWIDGYVFYVKSL